MTSAMQKPKILIISSVPGTLWAFYRVLIRQLVSSGWDVLLVSSEDPLLRQLQDEYQCRVFPIEIPRKMSPLSDLRSIMALVRILRREKVDVVHAHTPKGGMIGMIAAFLAQVPNRIYTMHGFAGETSRGAMRFLLRSIEKLSFRLSTASLVVSKSLAEKAVREKICRPHQVRILGDGTACGIDRGLFQSAGKTPEAVLAMRQKYGIPPHALVIGFVGRIVRDKGVECLVEAFRSIESSDARPVYLMLVGRFETVRDAISEQVRKEIENHPRIVTSGIVLDVVSHYYAMDLLVLPSRREGFNYVLLEAAACSLPTITTCATGCIDAVVHGETGLVVPIDAPAELAAAMRQLIEASHLREQFGKNGELRVDTHFRSDRLVKEHIELYERLITQSGR